MKAFGKNEYTQTACVNFERSKLFIALFADNFDIQPIITALQIITGMQVNPENTLIIPNEIQDAISKTGWGTVRF